MVERLRYDLKKELDNGEIEKEEFDKTDEEMSNWIESSKEDLERNEEKIASTKAQCTPPVKLIVKIEKSEVVE